MKKKICFIISSPLTAKAFLLKHFEVLSDEFEISLVANFEGEAMDFYKTLPLAHIKSIDIHRSINIIQDIKALLELRSYLKKMQFDAIHTVTPKAGLIGILAGRMAGIKNRIHIFTGQVWHTKTGLFKLVLMAIDKIIVKNATAILVDGESQKQYLIANKIVNKNNAFVLGKGSISGVDLNRFIPNESIRKQMPRAVIEAMSHGLPCIGSNVGGIPELLDKEVIVEKNNPNAIANLIEKFMNESKFYNTQSQRNFEESKQFDVEVLEEKRKQFYRYLIKNSN